MKKRILLITIMLVLSNRLATPDVLINERRRLLPAYIDAHKRHSMGLSVPLRWAPEVKAWEDRAAALPLKGQVNPYTSIKERSILGGTETLPETTATLYFEDSNGVVYRLLPQTYEQIVADYSIADLSSFIEDILLLGPFEIVGDSTNPDRQIYYKKYKEPTGKEYRGVVVGIVDKEIKTVYISDKKPK